MPELPEVQTVVSDLQQHVVGSTIVHTVLGENYLTTPGREEFISQTRGATIINAKRIAKNILLELDNSKHIHFHLAMTGQVLLRPQDHRSDKWVRVLFVLNKDSDTKHLRFCDMRMFGKAALLDPEEVTDLHKKYGPEPIEENLSTEEFYKQIKSKKTNIKNALLDQKVISGLGNIYATDALFLAGVHPETPTQDITIEQAEKLREASKKVLLEGISHRGSTLPDKMYVDLFGNSGSHQDHFKVYMQKNCSECGTKIDFIKINGRGTYYCPSCQKA